MSRKSNKPLFPAPGARAPPSLAGRRVAGRGFRCSARRSTSMPRSSTTRPGARSPPPRASTRACTRQLKTGADKAAAAAVGKLIAERAKAAGVDVRRVRPRRLSVSWPGQGPGRRRPRGRAEVLGRESMARTPGSDGGGPHGRRRRDSAVAGREGGERRPSRATRPRDGDREDEANSSKSSSASTASPRW